MTKIEDTYTNHCGNCNRNILNTRLKKENAGLKCECRRCVYTDCPCVLSDYGKDRNGICDHFKDVFDENAELKEQHKADLVRTQAILNQRSLQSRKLSKAKDTIKKLLYEYQRLCFVRKETIAEAEQFLKETK